MEELFNNGNIILTTTTLRYGNQYYPVSEISGITYFKMPWETRNFIINLIVGILGIKAILAFTTGWIIIGLILAGIGGFNCYNIATVEHRIVVVKFLNGDKLDFDFKEMKTALWLNDALHKARSLT